VAGRRAHKPGSVPAPILWRVLVLLLVAPLGPAAAATHAGGDDGLEMVAKGVVSTCQQEWAPSLTPDGDSLFFGVADPSFVSATRFWTIVRSRRGEGADGAGRERFGPPEIVPFSGRFSDGYPAVSPDGTRLLFASDRPTPGVGGGAATGRFDLWMVERRGDGWGEPRWLGGEVNSAADELAPCLTADGTLYFSSNRPGGAGGFDLYRARPTADGYGPAEAVGAPIASAGDERSAWIAPDGELLIFSSNGRAGGLGRDDLWVSRNGPLDWSAPRNLGEPVNSPASEISPWVSADGRTLYFSSRRGFGDRPSARPLSYPELLEALRSVENGGANLYRIAIDRVPALAPPPPDAPERPLPGPELFAPGTVSTREFEGHEELAPDGRSLYFTIYNRAFDRDTIVVSRLEDGRWTQPEVADFSGRWSDVSTGISPDGSRLVFSSHRPRGDDPTRTDLDLWVVERDGDGWGEPRNLGAPVNTPFDDYSPSFAADGTLFFCSNRPGGLGGYDIYRAPWSDGRFGEPENLGPPVNTAAAEWNVGVSPSGDLVVFMASGRPDSVGGDDLYATRLRAGAWQEPVDLRALNTPDNDYSPKVSPDGRSLFFGSNTFPRRPRTSYRELVEQLDGVLNGAGNIYRVDLEVVERALESAGEREAPPR